MGYDGLYVESSKAQFYGCNCKGPDRELSAQNVIATCRSLRKRISDVEGPGERELYFI